MCVSLNFWGEYNGLLLVAMFALLADEVRGIFGDHNTEFCCGAIRNDLFSSEHFCLERSLWIEGLDFFSLDCGVIVFVVTILDRKFSSSIISPVFCY